MHSFARLPASQGDAVPLGFTPCRGESLTPDPRDFPFAVFDIYCHINNNETRADYVTDSKKLRASEHALKTRSMTLI